MKSRHKKSYQTEHQPVDHKQEEPEGQYGKGEGEKNQDGADDYIDNAEEKCSGKGSHYPIYPDHSGKEVGDNQDGCHIDQQADYESHLPSEAECHVSRAV